jgi:DNA polymerase-3 subunit gamma/tau
MSYLVLARKWRPQGFDDLIGQEPIVRVLTNSISQGKIAHAYVFSGPRGVGKTSTARILAKALNCERGPATSPCGECGSCRAITEGHAVDVIEIDGASNNSVDDIRDLREKVKYAPSGGRYKIYIIDESHMLSNPAFNALLKTLEEPPPHVLFMLATTEVRKIPITVMSRCQHLPFRRVSTEGIKERLRLISSAEGIGISAEALSMVARAADGSIRDSLTILDQVASFAADVGEPDVKGLLDVSDVGSLLSMAEAVIGGDREGILTIVSELLEVGADLRAFTKDLIKFFRDLLVLKLVSEGGRLLDVTEEELGLLKKTAEGAEEEHLVLIMLEILKAEAAVRSSFSPRVALEMSLIKTSYLSTFTDVREAISALSARSTGPLEGVDEPLAGPHDERRPPQVGYREEIIEGPEVRETHAEGPFGAGDLMRWVVDNIGDVRISSMLLKAEPELDGDTLRLVFRGPDAEICAGPIKDKSALIEKVASEARGVPTGVEIHIRKPSVASGRTDLKDKVFSEPVIKEALDLFEGRVLDFGVVEEREDLKNGG